MTTEVPFDSPQLVTTPRYQKEANQIAMAMSQYSIDELEKELSINTEIAVENYKRFENFHNIEASKLQALLSYTGIVFQQLHPDSFSAQDWTYTQNHLRITSFCYGLLRPLDTIRPYRLEGRVKLTELGGSSLYAFWKKRLTNQFIDDINAAGGILCNLASAEMKKLFDWKRVEKEVRVITPSFQVMKGGELKTIVVYTKMCRGAMTRFILKNRLKNATDLLSFQWEGFTYDEKSTPENPSFILYS